MSYLDFLFLPKVLFQFHKLIHQGYITLHCHGSLGSSWLWQFLRLTLFMMILTGLRSTGQVFLQDAPLLESVLFFSRKQTGVIGYREKDHIDKVPFSSHIPFLSLAIVVFLRFPYCRVIYFFSFPHCILWKEVTMCSPRLRKSDFYMSFPLGQSIYINYLEFFCRVDLSLY